MSAATSNDMLPPPTERYTLLGWLHKNLFSTWYNGMLTILALAVIFLLARSALVWAVSVARWEVVVANFRLFMVGQYPADKLWRIWAYLYLLAGLLGLSWGVWIRRRAVAGSVLVVSIILLAIVFPFSMQARIQIAALAIAGVLGFAIARFSPKRLGRVTVAGWLLYFPIVILLTRGLQKTDGLLSIVTSSFWGGLLLTFLLTVVGIAVSFPFGVLLALGRQSCGRSVSSTSRLCAACRW